jgi:hypothetical protein
MQERIQHLARLVDVAERPMEIRLGATDTEPCPGIPVSGGDG